MKIQTFIDELLDHPLFYAICVIIVGLYSPFMCIRHIDNLSEWYHNPWFRITIIGIILVTSLVDIPLALLWTITYLALWICVWDRDTKKMLDKK
jgi:hypothetical protein